MDVALALAGTPGDENALRVCGHGIVSTCIGVLAAETRAPGCFSQALSCDFPRRVLGCNCTVLYCGRFAGLSEQRWRREAKDGRREDMRTMSQSTNSTLCSRIQGRMRRTARRTVRC